MQCKASEENAGVLQEKAGRPAALDLGEGWFGAIAVQSTVSRPDAAEASPQARDRVSERNALSTALAEGLYCILAQALIFIATTCPEVIRTQSAKLFLVLLNWPGAYTPGRLMSLCGPNFLLPSERGFREESIRSIREARALSSSHTYNCNAQDISL